LLCSSSSSLTPRFQYLAGGVARCPYVHSARRPRLCRRAEQAQGRGQAQQCGGSREGERWPLLAEAVLGPWTALARDCAQLAARVLTPTLGRGTERGERVFYRDLSPV